MIGYVSGQQSGRVVETCVLAKESGVNRSFTCQYLTDYSSGGGDSGAPILIVDDPTHVSLAGTHKGIVNTEEGTRRVFSPYGGMRQDFGSVTNIYTPPSGPPLTGVTISGPSTVPQDGLCTWFGSVSDGTAPYRFRWYQGAQLVKTEIGTTTEVTLYTGTQNFVLKLTAVDSGSEPRSGEDTKSITVSSGFCLT